MRALRVFLHCLRGTHADRNSYSHHRIEMEEAVAQSKLLSVLHRAQAFPLAAEASSTAGTRRGGVESKLLVSVCIKLDAASLERSSIEYVLQLGVIVHEDAAASAGRTHAASGAPHSTGYSQALLTASKIPEHQRYRPIPSPYNARTANYTPNGPRDAVGATPLTKYLGIDDVDDPYDFDARAERPRDNRPMNDNRPSVQQDRVRERQNASHTQPADGDMVHRGNGIVINSSPQHHHHHHHHHGRVGNGQSRTQEPAQKLPAKSPSSSRLARAEAALAAMERKQQVGGVSHNGRSSRSHSNPHDVLRSIDRVASRGSQNRRPPKSREYVSAFDSPSMTHRGSGSQRDTRQTHLMGYSDRRSSSLENNHHPPRYGGGGSFAAPQHQRENRHQRIPRQQTYNSTPHQHSRKSHPSQQQSHSHHHSRAGYAQQQVPGSKKKSFNEWLQNQSFQ